MAVVQWSGCILLKFYIKPQHTGGDQHLTQRCILLKFYIKPQRSDFCRHERSVVSYWNSTSNHNIPRCRSRCSLLYLIEILHQTTTRRTVTNSTWMLYLIEILHQTTTLHGVLGDELSLYLIEILHQTTTISSSFPFHLSCILLKFYIKPQHPTKVFQRYMSCILLKFYIKPQRRAFFYRSLNCCILLKFYIKPQHPCCCSWFFRVVSYWNSTSNHNTEILSSLTLTVVSYWNSTSNHNLYPVRIDFIKLYLIEILHQTTTTQRN